MHLISKNPSLPESAVIMWYSILIANQSFRRGGMILSCLFFVGIWGAGTVSATCGDYLLATNGMDHGHIQSIKVATAPPRIPRNTPVCSGPNCYDPNAIPAMPAGLVLTPSQHDMALTDSVRLAVHDRFIDSVESPDEPLLLSRMRGRVYRPPRIGRF